MRFKPKYFLGVVALFCFAIIVNLKIYSIYQLYIDSANSEASRVEAIARELEAGSATYSDKQIADLLVLAYNKESEKYLLRYSIWLAIGATSFGMTAFFIGAFAGRKFNWE